MAPSSVHNSKFADICRLCLKRGSVMSPIFDTNDNGKNSNLLAERITSIAHVEINPNDDLPTSICETCRSDVEKFHKFRLLVEVSDRALRSCLKSSQSSFQNIKITSDTQSVNNVTYTLLMPTVLGQLQIWDVAGINGIQNDSPKEIKQNYKEYQKNVNNIEDFPLENEISCELCLKSFHFLDDLKNHIVDHCSEPEKPTTAHKFVKLALESSPQRHMEADKLINDNLPPQIVNSLKDPPQPKKIVAIKFKCKYCSKLLLAANEAKHIEKCSSKKKDLMCDQCGKQFMKRSELRYHKGTHLSLPLTCEHCNKQFRNLQSFTIHLKRHTLGSRYNCYTCGKSYYTNSELTRHIQTHSEHKNHPCHLCDMSFASRPELNRHLKYHNGTKKFNCKLCSKSYYESGHLKVHERMHTGERPFVCQVCNKGFVTKSKLLRHTKIHEKESLQIDKNPNYSLLSFKT